MNTLTKTLLTMSLIVAALSAGVVRAADPQSVSASTAVPSAGVEPHAAPHNLAAGCTPPSDERECAPFHAEIRRHFSEREIGVLFGARTAYPGYAMSYERLVDRYQQLVRQYDQGDRNQLTAN